MTVDPSKGARGIRRSFACGKNEANDVQNLVKKYKLSRTGTNVRGIRNLEHVEASKLPKKRRTSRNEQRPRAR